MPKNKQQNKYSKWLLTIQSSNGSDLPTVDEVIEFFEFIQAPKYIFQPEIGREEKKLHYQCAFITKTRTRQTTLLKKMEEFFKREQSQFQLNKQAGSWEENVRYCSKLADRQGKSFFSNFNHYDGQDLTYMDSPETRRPFQQSIISMVLHEDEKRFRQALDRNLIYIYDKNGGLGKSKISKWFVHNFPNRVACFSTNNDSQLRSAAIDAGCRDLIIVDIPRATAYQSTSIEKMSNILSVLEDLKNGCLSSAFYGKYRTLVCPPCHILIFSNEPAPRHMLTSDRWNEYVINEEFELKSRDQITAELHDRLKDFSY